MVDLQQKTLILTGASLGIGRALSFELAKAGCNLVLNARHASSLAEVAAACRQPGATVEWVAGDAAAPDNAARMVEAALRVGNFYGFIHAAGVLRPGPLLMELPEAHFLEVLNAGVKAGYELVRAAVGRLLEQGEGLAVFFGSGAAEINTPGIGAYCIAKAAEEHLARQLAVEAPTIATFIYRPGVVETGMQQQARESRGGAAAVVQAKFWGYKNRGELITPEQTAKSLVTILTADPRRFHGKIATWRDGFT